MSKAKKLVELSVDELSLKAVELKKELFNLRFQSATAQLKNPNRIREVKKEIARVKTIITEKANA